MVPFHLQSGSDARQQATKEEIISKLRGDMIRREGFRPSLPGSNNDLGLGAVAEAFPGGGGAPTGPSMSLSAAGWRRVYRGAGAETFGLWRRLSLGRLYAAHLSAGFKAVWGGSGPRYFRGCVAAVICETRDLGFADSQRLALAVEKSGITGFALRKISKKRIQQPV